MFWCRLTPNDQMIKLQIINHPAFTKMLLHCKYLRRKYDQIAAIGRTSTVIRCNVPLQLNIPIETIRYPKISSKLIVKY